MILTNMQIYELLTFVSISLCTTVIYNTEQYFPS